MLWNSTYETGLDVVDIQHKELFDQIDILLDTSKADRIDSTLSFLENYVRKHFATEEAFLSQIYHPKTPVYPRVLEHQGAHEDFRNKFKAMKQEYASSGNNPIVAMKLTHMALNWLKDHIRDHDKEFCKFYLDTRER